MLMDVKVHHTIPKGVSQLLSLGYSMLDMTENFIVSYQSLLCNPRAHTPTAIHLCTSIIGCIGACYQ